MQNRLVKNSLCKKVLDHRRAAQECLSLGVITKKGKKDEEAVWQNRKFCSFLFPGEASFSSTIQKPDFNANGAQKFGVGVGQSSRSINYSQNWLQSVSVDANDKRDDIADALDTDVTTTDTSGQSSAFVVPSLVSSFSLSGQSKHQYQASRSALSSEVIDIDDDSEDEDRKNVLPFRVECQSCKAKLGADWKKHECKKVLPASKVEEMVFVDASMRQTDAEDSEENIKPVGKELNFTLL